MLRKIGFLLITSAFLSGAVISTLHPVSVNWTAYCCSLILGFLGLSLLFWHEKKTEQDQGKDLRNFILVENSLARALDSLKKIQKDQIQKTPLWRLPEEIDQKVLPDLERFVEMRKVIAHLYDLQSYADIMTEYACGERYLYRTWSASADGYIDEARGALARAIKQFELTQDKLNTAKTSSKRGASLEALKAAKNGLQTAFRQ